MLYFSESRSPLSLKFSIYMIKLGTLFETFFSGRRPRKIKHYFRLGAQSFSPIDSRKIGMKILDRSSL